jgi:hypothetical protein
LERNFMATKLEVITGLPDADAEPMPAELGDHGAKLWRRVQSEYAVDDCGGVELLTQACRALDRAEKCAGRIDAEGVRAGDATRDGPSGVAPDGQVK